MADGYSKVYGNSFAFIFGFGNMNRPWVFVGVMIGTILTLGWGLILINKDKKQKEGE